MEGKPEPINLMASFLMKNSGWYDLMMRSNQISS